MTHESPLPGQVLRSSPLNGYDAEEQKVADLDGANIISSEVEGKPGVHKPVLDIDLGVKVIPSSTEGHFHLMIDKEMSWDDYQRLLWVLADVGIIEENYASASDERGYTAVRLPWVHKDEPPEDLCRCPGCERVRRDSAGPTMALRPRACGRGWVDQGVNGTPCDCDDCHLEPDGRSRAELMRDREQAQVPCDCADCIPSPTHRIQVQQPVPPLRITWEGLSPTQVIMDEVQAWPEDRNPYYRRGSQ